MVECHVVSQHCHRTRCTKAIKLKLCLQIRSSPTQCHRRIASCIRKVVDRAVEHHLVVRHNAIGVAMIRDLNVIPHISRPILHVARNIRMLPATLDRVVPRFRIPVALRRVDDSVAVRNHLVNVHLQIRQINNRVIEVHVVLVHKVCRYGVLGDINVKDLAATASVVHRKLTSGTSQRRRRDCNRRAR